MDILPKLCIDGDGWGAITAYESLAKKSNSWLDIVTNGHSILSILRPIDSRVKDYNSSSAKYLICAGYKEIIQSSELKKKVFINI